MFRSWDSDSGECSGIAFVIAVKPLGRDDDIRDAHFLQSAMKVIAEKPGFVAGVELDVRAAESLMNLKACSQVILSEGCGVLSPI